MDEKLLQEVEKLRHPPGKNLPEIIHEALSLWIKRNETQNFERQWLDTLTKNGCQHKHGLKNEAA